MPKLNQKTIAKKFADVFIVDREGEDLKVQSKKPKKDEEAFAFSGEVPGCATVYVFPSGTTRREFFLFRDGIEVGIQAINPSDIAVDYAWHFRHDPPYVIVHNKTCDGLYAPAVFKDALNPLR